MTLYVSFQCISTLQCHEQIVPLSQFVFFSAIPSACGKFWRICSEILRFYMNSYTFHHKPHPIPTPKTHPWWQSASVLGWPNASDWPKCEGQIVIALLGNLLRAAICFGQSGSPAAVRMPGRPFPNAPRMWLPRMPNTPECSIPECPPNAECPECRMPPECESSRMPFSEYPPNPERSGKLISDCRPVRLQMAFGSIRPA